MHKTLDKWNYLYYHIAMKKQSKRVPNLSIRISREAVHRAKIEAVKSNMTLGAWIEKAIEEKIKREKKD